MSRPHVLSLETYVTRDRCQIWNVRENGQIMPIVTTDWTAGCGQCKLGWRRNRSKLNEDWMASRVPERGVEPPPTYVDMNLNHARLPIPPLGQERPCFYSADHPLRSRATRAQRSQASAVEFGTPRIKASGILNDKGIEPRSPKAAKQIAQSARRAFENLALAGRKVNFGDSMHAPLRDEPQIEPPAARSGRFLFLAID